MVRSAEINYNANKCVITKRAAVRDAKTVRSAEVNRNTYKMITHNEFVYGKPRGSGELKLQTDLIESGRLESHLLHNYYFIFHLYLAVSRTHLRYIVESKRRTFGALHTVEEPAHKLDVCST